MICRDKTFPFVSTHLAVTPLRQTGRQALFTCLFRSIFNMFRTRWCYNRLCHVKQKWTISSGSHELWCFLGLALLLHSAYVAQITVQQQQCILYLTQKWNLPCTQPLTLVQEHNVMVFSFCKSKVNRERHKVCGISIVCEHLIGQSLPVFAEHCPLYFHTDVMMFNGKLSS